MILLGNMSIWAVGLLIIYIAGCQGDRCPVCGHVYEGKHHSGVTWKPVRFYVKMVFYEIDGFVLSHYLSHFKTIRITYVFNIYICSLKFRINYSRRNRFASSQRQTLTPTLRGSL
jgi:hypothetical protein